MYKSQFLKIYPYDPYDTFIVGYVTFKVIDVWNGGLKETMLL